MSRNAFKKHLTGTAGKIQPSDMCINNWKHCILFEESYRYIDIGHIDDTPTCRFEYTYARPWGFTLHTVEMNEERTNILTTV